MGAAPQWFREQGVELIRTGRDMPGSNWHTYAFDPDGHTNELYYGIEQVGWDGYSKPRSMYYRGFREEPPLPQQSEFDEVQEALAKDIDTQSGYRYLETRTAKYDVDGVLLPRPFKIVRIGPVRLFVRDMAKAEAFYTQSLGFTLTEDVVWEGHRCVFLRTSNEHHAVALYPIELRERLGLSPHSSWHVLRGATCQLPSTQGRCGIPTARGSSGHYHPGAAAAVPGHGLRGTRLRR